MMSIFQNRRGNVTPTSLLAGSTRTALSAANSGAQFGPAPNNTFSHRGQESYHPHGFGNAVLPEGQTELPRGFHGGVAGLHLLPWAPGTGPKPGYYGGSQFGPSPVGSQFGPSPTGSQYQSPDSAPGYSDQRPDIPSGGGSGGPAYGPEGPEQGAAYPPEGEGLDQDMMMPGTNSAGVSYQLGIKDRNTGGTHYSNAGQFGASLNRRHGFGQGVMYV